jgi:hypothetical protein
MARLNAAGLTKFWTLIFKTSRLYHYHKSAKRYLLQAYIAYKHTIQLSPMGIQKDCPVIPRRQPKFISILEGGSVSDAEKEKREMKRKRHTHMARKQASIEGRRTIRFIMKEKDSRGDGNGEREREREGWRRGHGAGERASERASE